MSVKIDVKQLQRLQEKVDKVAKSDLEAFYTDCVKEIAARLLRKVIKRTPVGQYPAESGKVGGTLRRGWTAIGEIYVVHSGNDYIATISNMTEYASYVEFGHRQTPGRFVPAINAKLKVSWVNGQFMLTISEKEIQSITPKLLDKRVNELLRSVFDD